MGLKEGPAGPGGFSAGCHSHGAPGCRVSVLQLRAGLGSGPRRIPGPALCRRHWCAGRAQIRSAGARPSADVAPVGPQWQFSFRGPLCVALCSGQCRPTSQDTTEDLANCPRHLRRGQSWSHQPGGHRGQQARFCSNFPSSENEKQDKAPKPLKS